VGIAVAVGVGLGLALLVLLLVLALLQLLLLGGPARVEVDAGEGFGEEGVDLVVTVGWGWEGRVDETRTGGRISGASRGQAVSPARVDLLLALVLLVAQDGLASDLEPPARPLLAAFGGFKGGPDPVLDVPVGSAGGGDVSPLLILLVRSVRLCRTKLLEEGDQLVGD
jgi:hypothetical protein